VTFPCLGCGSACGLQTAANGTLTDGSGTATYQNDAKCEWVIASTLGQLITISFTEFQTQAGYDFVKLYQCTDIGCQTSQPLAELSGTYSTTQAVTSYTGFMKVVFTSDRSINYGGFTARWGLVRSLVLHHLLM
jgi:hypothetical protein